MKKNLFIFKKIEKKMYLITTVIFIVLIISALTVYYGTKKDEKNFFDIAEQQGNLIIKKISGDCSSLIEGEIQNFKIIEEKFLENKEIIYFKILNNYNYILLSNLKKETGIKLENPEILEVDKTHKAFTRIYLNNQNKRIFEISTPIFLKSGNKIGGKLVLGLSLDEIHLMVNSSRYKFIALGFSLFMLGGAGLIFNISFYSYRNVQNALENIKSYTSSILLSMDLGVIATDLTGKISIVNNAIKKILNRTNLIGENLFNIFRDKSEINEIFQEALNNFHGIENIELQYASENKNKFLRITTSILKNNEDIAIGLVVLVEDVTEVKELERQVYRSDKVSALGRFAAGIAHEIKNPLSAMNINVQLLEEELTNNKNIDSESQQILMRYINIINSETNRLEEIIRNLIDFTKTDKIKKESISIRIIIEQVVNLIEPEAKRRNVEIHQKINIASDECITCDRNKIKQLLLNLIINSLQAMPAGGMLTIAVLKNPSFVTIEIADTGIGIKKEEQNKIFDLYYTTKKSGSGLGLSICQRIIEEHNGRLEFISDYGKGTKFTIKLPIDYENPHFEN